RIRSSLSCALAREQRRRKDTASDRFITAPTISEVVDYISVFPLNAGSRGPLPRRVGETNFPTLCWGDNLIAQQSNSNNVPIFTGRGNHQRPRASFLMTRFFALWLSIATDLRCADVRDHIFKPSGIWGDLQFDLSSSRLVGSAYGIRSRVTAVREIPSANP